MSNIQGVYSKGKNDECYTLEYGVKPIVKYLTKNKIIWCPFDRDDSAFVTVLRENGFDVVNSHIDYGQDFFEYEPSKWDVIVSNPPFTNKKEIFQRALSFDKPFALLMSNLWLNDSAPKHLFKDKQLQLLMFDKRMVFKNNGVIQKSIPFSSSYFCYRLLPQDIIMERLESK